MDKASHTDLKKRLRQVEGALEQCQRMALASRFAGAVMHEVNNPLEAITNLVYLTKTRKDDPALVRQTLRLSSNSLPSSAR